MRHARSFRLARHLVGGSWASEVDVIHTSHICHLFNYWSNWISKRQGETDISGQYYVWCCYNLYKFLQINQFWREIDVFLPATGPPRVALVANLHCKLLFFSLEAGFVARLKKINIVDPNILRKKKIKLCSLATWRMGWLSVSNG